MVVEPRVGSLRRRRWRVAVLWRRATRCRGRLRGRRGDETRRVRRVRRRRSRCLARLGVEDRDDDATVGRVPEHSNVDAVAAAMADPLIARAAATRSDPESTNGLAVGGSRRRGASVTVGVVMLRLVIEGLPPSGSTQPPGDPDVAVELEFDSDWTARHRLVRKGGRWIASGDVEFLPETDNPNRLTSRLRRSASLERHLPRIERLIAKAIALDSRFLGDWWEVLSYDWQMSAPRSRRGRNPKLDADEIARLQTEEGLTLAEIAGKFTQPRPRRPGRRRRRSGRSLRAGGSARTSPPARTSPSLPRRVGSLDLAGRRSLARLPAPRVAFGPPASGRGFAPAAHRRPRPLRRAGASAAALRLAGG